MQSTHAESNRGRHREYVHVPVSFDYTLGDSELMLSSPKLSRPAGIVEKLSRTTGTLGISFAIDVSNEEHVRFVGVFQSIYQSTCAPVDNV